jgi:endoglycosylceramidase
MRRLAAATLASLTLLAADAGAAPTAPFGHAGRWITDAQGRVVVIHGVNMVYKRKPYAPDAIGFDEADAAFLAKEGFNGVRLGLIWAAVEPQPGVYDDAYLARIKATVALLRKHGIATQLDFHQDQLNERFYGEGFPDWAIQDDGLPNKPDFGFGPNYLLLSSLQRALDHFWNNDPGPGGIGLQDRYAAAWKHVAESFAGDEDLLGYDLFNEPFPGTVWQPCISLAGCPEFDAKLTAFTKRVVAAIRAADPRGIVWYEPNVIFNNGPRTHVVSGDERAGFSFHDYCILEPETGSNLGCDGFDDLVFANAERQSLRTGDALMLTEFGATDDADNNRAMAARADRTRMSWMWWHYCSCDDPTTTGPGDKQALVDDPRKAPQGANLRPGKLDLFARPYPRVVAGTPRSWSWDAATKTFRLRFTNVRAGGGGEFARYARSEVVLPARQFPDGYAVSAKDAVVRSAPGAQMLALAACPGAGDIEVTVTPRGENSQGCAAPALRISASPRRIRAATRARVSVTIRDAIGPVAGARVRLGTRVRRTDSRGRVVLRVRLRSRGRRAIVATAPGYPTARASVRVT